MLTFLLICILACTLLGLACAVYSYLALKGSARHADLATSSELSAHNASIRALDLESSARVKVAKAERYAAEAKAHAEQALVHSTEAAGHADDAALALGEMKPETVTIVNNYQSIDAEVVDGEPLFHYPEIERDCE